MHEIIFKVIKWHFFNFFKIKKLNLDLFKLKEIDLIKTFMEVLFMKGLFVHLLFVHLLYRESIGVHADVHMFAMFQMVHVINWYKTEASMQLQYSYNSEMHWLITKQITYTILYLMVLWYIKARNVIQHDRFSVIHGSRIRDEIIFEKTLLSRLFPVFFLNTYSK